MAAITFCEGPYAFSLRLRMMGPPGSLVRDPGRSSLKASSAREGSATAATAPAPTLRNKFRRVMAMGTSGLDCRVLLIAEKRVGGQSNADFLGSQTVELSLPVCLLETFDINFTHLKHGLADAR